LAASVSTVFFISMQAAGLVELPESPELPNIAEIGSPRAVHLAVFLCALCGSDFLLSGFLRISAPPR
jgi:hypothetical protein